MRSSLECGSPQGLNPTEAVFSFLVGGLSPRRAPEVARDGRATVRSTERIDLAEKGANAGRTKRRPTRCRLPALPPATGAGTR